MELLDFYADWCGPCQMMKPTVEAFEKMHPEIVVKRINIDNNQKLAREFGVTGIPCLVFLKDSKEVTREVGVVPLKKLVTMVMEK